MLHPDRAGPARVARPGGGRPSGATVMLDRPDLSPGTGVVKRALAGRTSVTAIIFNFDDFRSAPAGRRPRRSPGAAANDVDAAYQPMPFEAGNCEAGDCTFMALGPDEDTITFLPGLFAPSRK